MFNNNKFVITTLSVLMLLGLSSCHQKGPRIYNPVTKKQTVYNRTKTEYAPVLSLLDVVDLPETKQKLKNYILLHNDSYNKKKKNILFSPKHHNFPFVQYKNLVDDRISQLKEFAVTLRKKSNSMHDVLEKDILQLIAQLEALNDVIIVMEEYHQEKIRMKEDSDSIPMKIFSFGLSAVVKKLFFI